MKRITRAYLLAIATLAASMALDACGRRSGSGAAGGAAAPGITDDTVKIGATGAA
jgi:hypothetical protein